MNKLILVIAILLSGCQLTGSGETEYSLEPIENSKGEMVCCKANVYNTKDYDKLKFKFKKTKNGDMEVTLEEDGVDASTPAMVQSENNAKLLDAVTKLLPITGN